MSTLTEVSLPKAKRELVDQAVIRFAGDSGDGMQITGSQFTNTVALYGNDLATFPDYPAEIRATVRSEEHTSELQSRPHLVCRLLLEKKNNDSSDQLNTHTPCLHIHRVD